MLSKRKHQIVFLTSQISPHIPTFGFDNTDGDNINCKLYTKQWFILKLCFSVFIKVQHTS